MAITDLFNKSVEVRRRVLNEDNLDEFRQPAEDWETTTYELACAIQPQTGDVERKVQGQVVASSHVLYCAYGEDLQEDDRVVDGDWEYRIIYVGDDGGRGHHLKAELALVKGVG